MLKMLIIEGDSSLKDDIEGYSDPNVEIVGVFTRNTAPPDRFEAILSTMEPNIVILSMDLGNDVIYSMANAVKAHNHPCEVVIVIEKDDFNNAYDIIRSGVREFLLYPLESSEYHKVITHIKSRIIDNSGLVRELNKTIRALRDSFADRFLEEGMNSRYSIGELNDRYNFNLNTGIFQVIVVCFYGEFNEGRMKINKKQLDDIDDIIVYSARRLFDYLCYEMIPYIQGTTKTVFILNYSPEKDIMPKFHEFYQVISEFVDSYFESGIEFVLGIGSQESDYYCLNNSLKNAELSARCRMLKGSNKMYCYTDMVFEKEKGSDILPSSELSTIVDSAEVLDVYKTMVLVRPVLFNLTNASDPATVSFVYVSIVSAIADTVKNMGMLSESIAADKAEALARLDTAANLQQLKQQLELWVSDLFSRCISERKKRYLHPVREVESYISKKYYENLTLDGLSRMVGLSPSYLSTIFRRETGQNFSTYVTTYRIQEAKKLLVNTNMSMLEISEVVGYADSRYFSRIFRKVSGVSPSEYRKLHR